MLKFFIRLIGLGVVIGTLLVAGLFIEYRYFITTPLNLGEQGLHYEIAPGTSLSEIGRDLSDRGIIRHELYLVALGRWEGKANQVKAGEYQFAANATPRQLLDQIVAGRVVKHSLTLVEGWNFRQFMQAVNANPMLVHKLAGLDDQQIMASLDKAEEHPEGRFYPDTYHFPKGLTDTAFLQRAYVAMTQHLEQEWQNRETGLPIKTPYEALVLASIVEKETGKQSERPAIAGVFMRRLQQGMRLQTDPTVIYGMGERYEGNIRRSDLTQETPYNTYVINGLPPTPIAMPGAAALHAVLHPEPGETLYFVARGDGSHQFSATLEAHNAAVRKYQLSGSGSATPPPAAPKPVAP